mmetsp:Transcript_17163/g.42829  ORF Transcript_17163/g.42829 Transcript_17163/m.42829 type:complete len:196 (+) Transcript_17163:102-689(+)
MASQKFITAATAWSLRSPSLLLRQAPVSARLVVNNSSNYRIPAFSNPSEARRTVHVDHNRSSGENDNEDFTKKPARNRSRRSRSKRLSQEVPSYKEFVHRFTVLSLYRGFLKCIRDSMPHNKEDLRDQVRKEFQMNKSDTDPFSIKQNIADGQRRFEELQEFTGQSNKYSGESWINIKDPDDPRGRVGTGWPWAK